MTGREWTRYGETARQLRAVVPPHERIRDPDRRDGLLTKLLRRIVWSLPGAAAGVLAIVGWAAVTNQTVVPRSELALLHLARDTLRPLNQPGNEITEPEIKDLAETIRQLAAILAPDKPRPWLKDLARMTTFNGNADRLHGDRAILLRHFLDQMEKVPPKDRSARMADIILFVQSRNDWMPYAEMLTRFSVDLIDLSRADRIPALEQAIRVALEKARAEGDLEKARATLEKEMREIDGQRQIVDSNQVTIRRYIATTLAGDRGLRACADTFVVCQRKIEKNR